MGVVYCNFFVVLFLFLIVIFKLTGNLVNTEYSCFDSDGGRDYYVKGETKVRNVSKGIDFCTDDNRLKEYYCLSQTSWNHLYKECENGCKEGVCVSKCENIGEIKEGKYCDNDKKLKSHKETGGFCENDFECVSGTCSSGICGEVIEDIGEEISETESVEVGEVEIVRKEGGLFRKTLCKVIGPFSEKSYEECIFLS
ncbi:hypothetical protein CMI39_03890 [Candidatus Pacearchaeota archaeon]|jgi:hypothetical protein|nr:hypothetical protein [Candidatus Pacearchaeota archaeon]|tara:strand:+ start:2882 stop:3472 length:591 start_codon:yes stop_codon:yes gene_type:complete